MKKIKYGILLAAVMLGAISCKEYLDVNEDPSNPQVAEGYVLLPPIFSQMVQGEAFDSRYIGKYVQNWGEATANNAWDRHGYDAGTDRAGEIWRSHYYSIGQNLDLVLQDGQAKGKWDYVGVAKAIRAWSWQTTTDFHGEIILNQAWEPNRYQFEFDSQEEVYQEVVRLSNEALQDLERTDGLVSEASLGRGDLVYKGNREKWTKFVYAVLARNANHRRNKASYNPDQVIEYVDKSFGSNADNFNVPYAGTSSSDANFFGPTRNNLNFTAASSALRQSSFIVSLLNGTVFEGIGDPRLPVMLSPSPDSVYRGVLPGQGDPNNLTGNTRRIPTLWGSIVPPNANNKYIFRDNAPHPLLTYPELQFIKAEAAFVKGDRALALDAYRKGIAAHMELARELTPGGTSPSASQIAAYLASEAVAQTPETLTISDIMLQKYIAMWGYGVIETWVDMRRYQYSPEVYTGFTLPANLFPDNNGKPAQRVRPRYNSEYVWNRQSLDAIGGNNPDFHTYEPWFTIKE